MDYLQIIKSFPKSPKIKEYTILNYNPLQLYAYMLWDICTNEMLSA